MAAFFYTLVVKPYNNTSGSSGVVAFEIKKDSISIQFVDGSVYLYDYKQPGSQAVEQMKKLALAGKGLSTFISTRVKKNFAKKSFE